MLSDIEIQAKNFSGIYSVQRAVAVHKNHPYGPDCGTGATVWVVWVPLAYSVHILIFAAQ